MDGISFDDRIRQLKEELSKYGYVAFKKENVMGLGSSRMVSLQEVHIRREDKRYQEYIREDLAVSIAIEMLKGDCLDFSEREDGRGIILTARAMFIKPKTQSGQPADPT